MSTTKGAVNFTYIKLFEKYNFRRKYTGILTLNRQVCIKLTVKNPEENIFPKI